MKPEQVLRTFAELAKTGPAAPTNVLRNNRDFEWVQYKSRRVFEGKNMGAFGLVAPSENYFSGVSDSDTRLARLVSAGALHRSERLLRVGWVWLAGTVERDGKSVQYCFPLLSVPVAKAPLTAASMGFQLVSAVAGGNGDDERILEAVGDPEISSLIDDETVRDALANSVDFGESHLKDHLNDLRTDYLGPRLAALDEIPNVRAWCERAAASVGLEIEQYNFVTHGRPPDRSKQDGIIAFLGFGLYVDQAPTTETHRGSLMSLALMKRLNESAFAKMYGSTELSDPTRREIVQFRPMSARQSTVAGHASAADVAVISGAPGTGKTHVLSVLALDAIARGESVLVVGSSPYSVDVLLDHFASMNGPTPIAFGGSRHTSRLALELSEALTKMSVEGSGERVSAHHKRRSSIERMLRAETEAKVHEQDPAYRIDRTAELDRAGDLDELAADIERFLNPRPLDFWGRRRRKKIERRLGIGLGRSDIGIDPEPVMQKRVDELLIARDAQRLLAADGLSIEAGLSDLVALDEQHTTNLTELVNNSWLTRLDKADRRMLATVSHAMSAGRTDRRRLLAAAKRESLLRAAPLWVGPAADVNDVLPRSAAMFDLVIIDEASQMTQPHAAAALVRAKRAIVCGDPNQLGQVSFVSEEQVHAAAQLFGTKASIVDTRRNSIYDVAASQVPVQFLDEHFRSVPHLIEFSARRFYSGRLHAATRHPSNEAADHIHVEIVDGERTGTSSSKKVNVAEIERCIEVANRHIAQGCRSIGFMSPFRAQADALEAAILENYRLEEIEAYGLRVGTVHGFQGDEREVVIISWAVGPDESASAWRFVNQSNLFNVMVTRARDQVVIVTSDPNPPGLAGEYLKWSEPLTDIVRDSPTTNPWVAQVAEAFNEQNVSTRTGYHVGRHHVDLVVGTGEAAVAVDCLPHEDGTNAHLDRALMLRRSGWRAADAFETRWKGRTGEFAIELLSQFPDLKNADG